MHEGDAEEDTTCERVGDSKDLGTLSAGWRANRPHAADEAFKEAGCNESYLGPEDNCLVALIVLSIAAVLLNLT